MVPAMSKNVQKTPPAGSGERLPGLRTWRGLFVYAICAMRNAVYADIRTLVAASNLAPDFAFAQKPDPT